MLGARRCAGPLGYGCNFIDRLVTIVPSQITEADIGKKNGFDRFRPRNVIARTLDSAWAAYSLLFGLRFGGS
jgi:hypothetical protein